MKKQLDDINVTLWAVLRLLKSRPNVDDQAVLGQIYFAQEQVQSARREYEFMVGQLFSAQQLIAEHANALLTYAKNLERMLK